MLKNFRGLFSRDLSIDLGTANTLIYIREEGIVWTNLRRRPAPAGQST